MKLHSPWIVAITAVLVIALGMLQADQKPPERIHTIYDRDVDASRRGPSVPPDRWIGLVLVQEGWERVPAELGVPWAMLQGIGPDLDVPDFEAEVAVVAYMGSMPTGGYAIRLNRVEFTQIGEPKEGEPASGRLSLVIAVQSPGEGALVTQAFTNPADVVALSREAWPVGALDGIAAGTVDVTVVDQDGRDWGPVHILSGGL